MGLSQNQSGDTTGTDWHRVRGRQHVSRASEHCGRAKMKAYGFPSCRSLLRALSGGFGPDHVSREVAAVSRIERRNDQGGKIVRPRAGGLPGESEAHRQAGRAPDRRHAGRDADWPEDAAGIAQTGGGKRVAGHRRAGRATAQAEAHPAAQFRRTGRHHRRRAQLRLELQRHPARLHLHPGDAPLRRAHAGNQVWRPRRRQPAVAGDRYAANPAQLLREEGAVQGGADEQRHREPGLRQSGRIESVRRVRQHDARDLRALHRSPFRVGPLGPSARQARDGV